MENLYVFAVVPHAGTWIEINIIIHPDGTIGVVPHAGTWIEINALFGLPVTETGRSPRGNVD